jgi:hypothetical protein
VFGYVLSVVMLCAPDVPMMVYLDEEEIVARAHLRVVHSGRAGCRETGCCSVLIA